jgi:hypothetical protein
MKIKYKIFMMVIQYYYEFEEMNYAHRNIYKKNYQVFKEGIEFVY